MAWRQSRMFGRHSGTPVKMHVGTQQGPTTPRMLQYFKRHGVNHICGYPPDPGAKEAWTADDLQANARPL